MSWIGRLLDLFRPQAGRDTSAHWIYVRCDSCGELLHTRIDLHHDLSVEYGGASDGDRYYTRKLLIGRGPCFQRIEVELTYDDQRRLIDRTIQGGAFVSEERYFEDQDPNQPG
jgi:hypothetical protein